MIAVSEVFGPVIQGEGPLVGRPTIFVRTGGCDFRCSWCDTPYAVLPVHATEWTQRTADEVFEEVKRLSAGTRVLVTLSGGNPALQRDLAAFVERCTEEGYPTACETQGSIAAPWFGGLDWLILSPKPPSAEVGEPDWTVLAACAAAQGPIVAFKVVVMTDEDWDFALDVGRRFPADDLYLQVANPLGAAGAADTGDLLMRYRLLAERVTGDPFAAGRVAGVLPQLHVLAWGAERGR